MCWSWILIRVGVNSGVKSGVKSCLNRFRPELTPNLLNFSSEWRLKFSTSASVACMAQHQWRAWPSVRPFRETIVRRKYAKSTLAWVSWTTWLQWTCHLHSPHADASLVYSPHIFCCCPGMKEIEQGAPVRSGHVLTVNRHNNDYLYPCFTLLSAFWGLAAIHCWHGHCGCVAYWMHAAEWLLWTRLFTS